ncbi:fructosamine kinase family protein [Fulvivirga sediminis]|uniref:Fructosamine kinase family protein n=1 Tax=Fulvivirga sediminis TaxID=2803949 RepID=A0A937F5Q9_9BACT|nr:fructosamine kinase family protein [Fulvivirga sediminis]MBL3654754.1 fructosamine kinase family protein [Fulvivirga sediminis]
MVIPKEIREFCQKKIGNIQDFTPASGGCINHGGTTTTTKGEFFLKWNSASLYPKMFEVEAKGLQLLSEPKCIKIPEVIFTYEGDEYSCLILENIKSSTKSNTYNKDLAEGLACIHQQKAEKYGLDHDNYMGSLDQSNAHSASWADFFYKNRIAPQVKLALSNGKMSQHDYDKFCELADKLPSLLSEEAPTLIHGDLWGGNIIVGASGEPVLIDPAVSFAHREMDLAMTTLFGGFDQSFYDAYMNISPLPEGYRERWDIYNLYPLLVHVNLFGGGYHTQAMNILSKFIR